MSEALAKNLPMLAVSIRSPGTRSEMLIFWSTTAWRRSLPSTSRSTRAVYELFCNPVRLETVRRTMSEIAHPDATERLAEFVLRKR